MAHPETHLSEPFQPMTTKKARLRKYIKALTGGLVLASSVMFVGVDQVAAESVWSDAIFIETPASNFDVEQGWINGNWDEVRALSCAGRLQCTLAGSYNLNQVGHFGSVITQSNGTWSQNKPPASWYSNDVYFKVRNISANVVKCLSPTSCVLAGREGYSPVVATSSNGVWGPPQFLPGFSCVVNFEWPRGCTWGATFSAPQGTPGMEPDANNISGGGIIQAMDCSSVGNCVVAGPYMLLNTSFDQAAGGVFVAVQTNGVWSTPIEIPGMSALGVDILQGNIAVNGLSCTSAGNCVLAGMYPKTVAGFPSEGVDPNLHCCKRAFVATLTNGVWSNATPIPGLTSAGESSADNVDCPSVGNCIVTGLSVLNGNASLFSSTLANGTWSTATQIPGTALTAPWHSWWDLQFRNLAVTQLDCASVGNCTLAGSVRDSSEVSKAFIATQTSGIWSNASLVPGLSSLGNNTDSRISSLSCPTAGECVAVGNNKTALNIGGRSDQPFVVVKSNGIWGNARTIPGLDLTNSVMDPGMIKVSCFSAGECSVAGSIASNTGSRIFVTTYSDPNPPPPSTSAAPTTTPTTVVSTTSPTVVSTTLPTVVSTTLPTAPIAGPLAPGLGKARIGTRIIDVVTTITESGNTVISVGGQTYNLPAKPIDTSKKITISGSGAQPGSTVAIQLFSTPQILGYATVAADGTFSAEVSVPADTPSGDHNLQMVSVAADGTEVVVQFGVSVMNSMQLPATGSQQGPAQLAVFIIALGLLAVVVRRRVGINEQQ